MSNRRFIVFFLLGIALLSGALVFLSWRARVVATVATQNTLCTLPAESVVSVELVYGGTNAVTLARVDGGGWRLTAPYAAPADSAAVARLLDVATTLRVGDMRTAAELADLHEDFADFGLDARARVALRLCTEGRTEDVRVLFGSLTASGREVYARTEGLQNVFTLPAEAVAAIPSGADGFRRRELVSALPEEIDGIDLRAPESPFMKLVRHSAGWTLATSVEAPADAAAVESLVAGLTRARIAEFVLPSAANPESGSEGDVIKPSALVPYGLAAEAGYAVTIRSRAGTAEQIVFGDPVGTNYVYALVQGGTAVVLLDRAAADLCRAGGASFRDTRVFPVGKDEEVRSISLREGPFVYVLSQTNGVWRLAAPVDAAADPEVAAAVVDCVLRLRQHDVPEKAPEKDPIRVSISTAAGTRPDVTVPKTVFPVGCSFVNLRTKTFFELDPASVRRLSSQEGEGVPVAVVRDAERGIWGMDVAAGKGPATVSQDAVKALLTALTRVEAVGVETLAATPEDFRRCGLQSPAFTVAVDFNGADTVRRNILLGGVAPGGGRYATVGGADTVFILSRATVTGLTAPITE